LGGAPRPIKERPTGMMGRKRKERTNCVTALSTCGNEENPHLGSKPCIGDTCVFKKKRTVTKDRIAKQGNSAGGRRSA